MRPLRSAEVIVAIVVLGCFVLLGWLDYQRQSREVERFDTFSSFDFQRGGYHAWYDLLEREGVNVTRLQRRPAYLNDSIATLVVANNFFDALLRAQLGQSMSYYTAGDLEKLRKWVDSGGRLVWLMDQPSGMPMQRIFARTDAIAAANGSTRKETLEPRPAATEPSLQLPTVSSIGSSNDAAVAIAPSPLTAGVKAVSGSSRLRIPFDSNPGFTPLMADAKGAVVAWYRLGKGSVVVVTDETLFQNSRLAKADNARLAYNLVALDLQPGDTVAFDEWLHGYQSGDTWWSITPYTLRLALAIATGALLLLLLGAVWRFGPAARLPENVERTSEEYLLSMAALLARGGAARKAVHDLAQMALRVAARSVGMPDATPASAIAMRLRGSEAGDRRAHDLLTLERLAGYQHPTTAELVQAAHLSRGLRKELSFDGTPALQPRRSSARRSA